ncbi:MAG: SMC-Scp complex subunit ScpB, partial [Candidatus Neoclostridium sp.]
MISKDMIDEILESLLFVSGSGLALSDIKQQLEIGDKELNDSIDRLGKKYGGKCGIRLIKYNNKIQLASNPDYSDVISCVLNPIKERELSNAAMETMAIVAYRQPVTRLEIEQIRGVNCEYTVQMLLKHDLIEVVGRKDGVGKPLLFGTTDNFLKRFQIASLDELPDYEQLLQSIRVIESGDADKPTESVGSDS